MTNSTNGVLLYRATRDGFTAKAFHEKCDGKANTLTIIMTNENYVFGGYTAAEWNSAGFYIEDSSAFIFSLRRNGISKRDKLTVKNEKYAINGNSKIGPSFGYIDIRINDRSDINTGSRAIFCSFYQCPPGFTTSLLAGSYDKWLTSEIEVYSIHQAN